MKINFQNSVFVLLFLVSNTSSVFAQTQNTQLSQTDAKVKALLSRMTLEEKVGQMAQITLDVITKGPDRFSSNEPVVLDDQAMKRAFVDYKIGSVLNTANNRARTPETWFRIINGIQKAGAGRLNIPIIYGIDAIHGATYTAGATMFPQDI